MKFVAEYSSESVLRQTAFAPVAKRMLDKHWQAVEALLKWEPFVPCEAESFADQMVQMREAAKAGAKVTIEGESLPAIRRYVTETLWHNRERLRDYWPRESKPRRSVWSWLRGAA